MKKFACAAAAALALTGVDAGHIDEKLSADKEADETASKKAHCWCQGMEEVLAARSREGESQTRYLSSQKDQRDASNNLLRLEIKGHHKQANEHQQSLDSGAAVMGKSQADFEEEAEFHEKAITAVKTAMDKIPEGQGGEVRGALRGLHDTFSKNLEEAKEQQESKFAGLREQKSKMLDLANQAAEMKAERLAAGEKASSQAEAQLRLYGEQRDADFELSSQLRDACSALESDAAERLRLRNEVDVAVSQAKVDEAHAASQKAALKVLLSTRRGVQQAAAHSQYSPVEEATETAKGLAKLLAESAQVEEALQKTLSSTVMNVHLAGGEGAPAVKTAVDKLGAAAEKNAGALPQLFDKVRAAGQKCSQADAKLVDELKADEK